MPLESFRFLPAVHALFFRKDAAGEGDIIKSTEGAFHVNASPLILTITPSDATVYTPSLLGFRVGVTGNVVVRSNGVNVTISNVQVGEQIAGNIDMILSTGTTATGIIGWKR